MSTHYDRSLSRADESSSLQQGNTVDMIAIASTNQAFGFLETLKQVRILSARRAYLYLKAIDGLGLMIARNAVPGLVIGGLYFRTGKRIDDGQLVSLRGGGLDPYSYNMFTVMFLCVIFIMFVNAVAIPSFFSIKKVFKQEQVRGIFMQMWVFLADA
jgi:hypothetical protein